MVGSATEAWRFWDAALRETGPSRGLRGIGMEGSGCGAGAAGCGARVATFQHAPCVPSPSVRCHAWTRTVCAMSDKSAPIDALG